MLKTPRSLRRNERKRARKKRWTRYERGPAAARLGRLSTLSGFVAALLLPGGVALLPALAWWQRHQKIERERELGRAVRHRLRA
jgi:uncharacterized membrane protein YfcA